MGDFVVVAASPLPAAGPLSVIRSLRILRALRLVAMVPSMRRVATALVKSVPGLLHAADVEQQHQQPDNDLFRAGGDLRVRRPRVHHPHPGGTFTVLNLFIAVVCSAMESEVNAAPTASDDHVLAAIRALRAKVRALRLEPAGERGRPARAGGWRRA